MTILAAIKNPDTGHLYMLSDSIATDTVTQIDVGNKIVDFNFI